MVPLNNSVFSDNDELKLNDIIKINLRNIQTKA